MIFEVHADVARLLRHELRSVRQRGRALRHASADAEQVDVRVSVLAVDQT